MLSRVDFNLEAKKLIGNWGAKSFSTTFTTMLYDEFRNFDIAIFSRVVTKLIKEEPAGYPPRLGKFRETVAIMREGARERQKQKEADDAITALNVLSLGEVKARCLNIKRIIRQRGMVIK